MTTFTYVQHDDSFRSDVGGQTYTYRELVLLALAGVKYRIEW